MKKVILLILTALPFLVHAQIVNQPGEVREITYHRNTKGDPISDVIVKVETESRSDETGNFVLPISAKNNVFAFEQIRKEGYLLISPSYSDMHSQKFALNPDAPLTVIMAKNSTLRDERRRIENNIRREKEAEIAKQQTVINEQKKLLEQLSDQSVQQAMQAKIDSLEKVLYHLKEYYYNSDSHIVEEADKLARIDYQTLDSMDALILDLKKAGKGAEVVQTAQAQISPELLASIKKDPLAISKSIEETKKEFEKLEKELLNKENLRDHSIKWIKEMAEGYRMIYQYDSASYYYILRTQMDTTNWHYLVECGNFLSNYACLYDSALYYLRWSLHVARQQYGKISMEAAVSNEYIADAMVGNMEEQKLIQSYYNNAVDIYEKIIGKNCLQVARCYQKLAGSQIYAHEHVNYALKSLEILENLYPKDHVEIARGYYSLGYGCLGYYSDYGKTAKSYFDKAHAILEKNGETETQLMADIYIVLANFSDSAEYFYRKVLEIDTKLYGENHVRTAIDLAYLANMSEDSTTQFEYAFKAYEIYTNIYGDNHIATAEAASYMASLYYAYNDYINALKYIFVMDSILLKSYGKRFQFGSISSQYYEAGKAAYQLGNYDLALKFFLKSYNYYEDAQNGNIRPIAADNHVYLAFCYIKLGDSTNAVKTISEALPMIKRCER